jgi:hypothetical protein
MSFPEDFFNINPFVAFSSSEYFQLILAQINFSNLHIHSQHPSRIVWRGAIYLCACIKGASHTQQNRLRINLFSTQGERKVVLI